MATAAAAPTKVEKKHITALRCELAFAGEVCALTDLHLQRLMEHILKGVGGTCDDGALVGLAADVLAQKPVPTWLSSIVVRKK